MISEYRRFLRDRGGKDELVAALAASGHALEAALLGEWSGGRLRTQARSGPYAGRRAWVGTTLPPEAREGDLWLDVVELMPMLLVPWSGLPRPLGWIALRPVERWQLGGDESVPATGVSYQQAAAYAQGVGKSVATRTDWQVAAEGIDVTPLWGTARREWDSAVFDEVHSVFGRDTLDVDPHEAPDDPPGTPEEQRLFFYDTDAPADVGFRTFVRHDLGLRGGAKRDAEPVDPVPLTDAFTVFLRERTGRDALVVALGDRLEASLLAEWTGGVHRAGPTTWVGPGLPADARLGDVWLDTAELMPMLRNAAGWLALRPVERWQYGAFLRVAKLRGKPKPVSWFTPLDRTRLLAGPETGAVSRLLHEEARLYADWFGKEIAGRASRRGEPLWGAVREWAEEAEPGIFGVIDAATVDLDPLAPEPPGRWDESRLRFEAWWAPFGVGFRTHQRA